MQTGQLEVVPIEAMLAGSHAVSTSGAISAASAARQLAADAGAGTLISGAYYSRAGSIHFEAQIVAVGRRRLLHTLEPVAVSPDQLVERVEAVRQRLTGALACLVHAGALAGSLPRRDSATPRPPPARAAEALGDAGDAYAAALLRLELAGILRHHDPGEAQRLAEDAAACAARLQAWPLRDRAAGLLAALSVATPP